MFDFSTLSFETPHPDELAAMGTFYGQLRNETDKILVPDYCAAFTKEFLQAPWHDLFEHPLDFEGWKIMCEGKPIGLMRVGKLDAAYAPYLQSPLPEATGELHEIYLAPEYKGKGIGGLLYNKARQELTTLGYKNMFIATYANNDSAQAFYLHMGAKSVGEGTFEQVLNERSYFVKVAFFLHRDI